MLLLNFTHPFTSEQLAQIDALAGARVERVIGVSPQFEIGSPFAPQVDALLAQVPLTAAEWQTTPLLIMLPALNTIAAVLLAELHGRMGYFPAVVRLRPTVGNVPLRYEVAEIINLQAVRQAARPTHFNN
jgi:hypothetical protein